MSVGSLYQYFPNKASILLGLLEFTDLGAQTKLTGIKKPVCRIGTQTGLMSRGSYPRWGRALKAQEPKSP